MAAALCVIGLLATGCSGDDPGTGPTVDADVALRNRALAAGLAALAEEPPRPVDNPLLAERVELGRLLFFDPILSGPRDLACSTCHLASFGFADGRQFPAGAGADGLGPDRTDPAPSPLRLMPRNSPTTFNAGLFGRGGVAGSGASVNGRMFWGGSAFGLEDQVLNPIVADLELRGLAYSKVMALDSVVLRLRGIPEYVNLFGAAFPDLVQVFGLDAERLITTTTLRRGLAAYVRELITPESPFDRFMRGENAALSSSAKAGLDLFVGEAGCGSCHTGALLSDFDMHVLGARQVGLGRDTTPGDDLGWGEVGGTPYSFRTPPLRQVGETAPYLHAGTAETLEAVIRFKARAVSETPRVANSDLDPDMKPLDLSDGEIASLVAFLHALTDNVTTATPLFQAPAQVPSGLTVPTLSSRRTGLHR